MNTLLTVFSPLIALGVSLGAMFVPHIQNVFIPYEVKSDTPQQEITLGASSEVPTTVAFFETTLQSAISSSATTFTLTSATDDDGNSLASSTYAFIIDEGSSNSEIVVADCTGTVCINAVRGVSVLTGTSSVATLQKQHRRGASVKITDAPILLILQRLASGIMAYPNAIKYKSFVSTSTIAADTSNLVNVDLLNYTAFNGAGVVNAGEGASGVVEMATQIEMASSTATGSSGAALALQAKYATSSPYTTGHFVPITKVNGKLDNSFISLATTTTIGDFPAYSIGKNIRVITTMGTSTFDVPSGVTKIKVELVGAGGYGGNGNTNVVGSGGGAGGYAMKYVDVTGTSTIQVYVASSTDGGAGETTKFGTNGSYLYATGGGVGAANTLGGAGGRGFLGDLNISGGDGMTIVGASSGVGFGGHGGASFFGGGGYGATLSGRGSAGRAYGSGGGGGTISSYMNTNGEAGMQGVIIITW